MKQRYYIPTLISLMALFVSFGSVATACEDVPFPESHYFEMTEERLFGSQELEDLVWKVNAVKLSGDIEGAVKLLDEAVKANVSYSHVLYLLKGAIYTEQRRFDEALSEYENAVAADPKQVDAYKMKIDLLENTHRLEEVPAEYDRLIAQGGHVSEYRLEKAEHLLELGKFKEAKSEVLRIPADDQDYAGILGKFAEDLYSYHRVEDAISFCERVSDSKALEYSSRLYASTGRGEEFLKKLDAKMEGADREKAAGILSARVWTLVRLDRFDEALKTIDLLNRDYVEKTSVGSASYFEVEKELILVALDRNKEALKSLSYYDGVRAKVLNLVGDHESALGIAKDLDWYDGAEEAPYAELALGRYDKVIDGYEGSTGYRDVEYAYALMKRNAEGDADKLAELYKRIESRIEEDKTHGWKLSYGDIYDLRMAALMGKREEMLDALKDYIDYKPLEKPFIRADIFFEAYRDDPGFIAIVGE